MPFNYTTMQATRWIQARRGFPVNDVTSPWHIAPPHSGQLIKFCELSCVVVAATPTEVYLSPLGTVKTFKVKRSILSGKWEERGELIHA